MGIIFISHFLEQIYELCSRITILRNGELVGAYDIDKLPQVELIAKMVGKDLDSVKEFDKMGAKSVPSDEVFLEAKNIGCTGKLNNVDLTIHKGEVIGLGGLLGSGRTETAELLFGVNSITKGEIIINGKKVNLKNPIEAMNEKIAFCPEDRKVQGIIGSLSVRENIILALQAKKGMFKYIPYKEQVVFADDCIQLLKIKVSDREQLVSNLSGGNQQKVIIARWLITEPNLLILDEPTRGIDVGTKSEIQKMAVALAKSKGMSVIFISSEMDEMIRTCTKITVIRDRKKVAEIERRQVTSETL